MPGRSCNVYVKTGKERTFGGIAWTSHVIDTTELTYINEIS